MTASIAVLKSGNIGIDAMADYYIGNTNDDYYLEGTEPPGEWHGGCAEFFGLVGIVLPEHFRNLLAGRSPDGLRVLVRVTRKVKFSGPEDSKTKKKKRAEHVPGVDITFSLPKSVTAIWAVLSRKDRKRLERLIIKAIKKALNLLVREVPLARKGRGGLKREYAEIAAAIFRHSTSRKNNDPQLHYHIVIPNVVRLRNGSFAKINTHLLHEWTRTLGPLIRNNVAALLQKEMGFELYQPKLENGKQAGWFEIKGVPEKLCEHWSSRSREINQVTQLFGGSTANAKAKQNANLMTRTAKEELPSQAELFSKWRHDAKKFRFNQAKAERLMNRPQKNVQLATEFNKALQASLKELTDEYAYFEKRKLLQLVSERLQAVPITATQLFKAVNRELQQQKQVLALTTQSGKTYYTTPEMWKTEERLIGQVAKLEVRPGAEVTTRHIDKSIAKHPLLSDEQVKAVRHLLEAKGSIRTLVGIAGSGKSYALDAVRVAFENAGYTVIGGALSGVAKEELASQANIKSRTIASYRYHFDKTLKQRAIDRLKHDLRMLMRAAQGKSTYSPNKPKLNKKTVLVVDEAGMIGSRTMTKLLGYVEKAGATVVLVGDAKQLSPIEAGGPFEHILREVRPARLSENRRLKDPADIRATSLIREGKTKEALQDYLERGRLFVAADRSEAAKQLVDEWSKDGAIKDPKGSIILTQTRAEAKELNQYCQLSRLLSGALSKKLVMVGTERIHERDRIMFHKPFRLRGIENGFQATVVRIDRRRREVTICLDRKPAFCFGTIEGQQTVTLTYDQMKQAEAKLAYASTTHKLQGQTSQRSYVLMGGPMTSQEMAYVQVTRARENTKLFIDRAHAGRELELIEKEIAKSKLKLLAHDMAQLNPTQ